MKGLKANEALLAMSEFGRRAEWAMERERANENYIARRSARDAKFQKMIDEVIEFAPFPEEWANTLGRVSALNTARKLMDEGAKMRHCVGGEQFRQAMRKGRALYFHLQAGEDRSTLEIQRHGERYFLGQHCGPCNARPNTALQHLASCFLSDGLKSASGTLNTNGESKNG